MRHWPLNCLSFEDLWAWKGLLYRVVVPTVGMSLLVKGLGYYFQTRPKIFQCYLLYLLVEGLRVVQLDQTTNPDVAVALDTKTRVEGL